MAGRSKRKLEDFDPTKSDSDDENYDESPTKRTSRKSTKSKKKSSRPKKTKRSRTKYSGSDIEEDSEDFSESSLGDNFDQSEEEEVERTQTGRPLRRTVKAVSTFEEPPSREDTPRSVSPDTEPDAAQKNPPVVDRREGKLILKVDPDRLAKVTPARTTRAGSRALKEASLEPANRPRRTTRAHTEEGEELIALSVSGRHAVVQDSVSPDGASRTRPTRGTKGLKKPFPPVIEATQESTILSAASQDDPDQMDVDDEESGKNDDREIPDSHETKDETFSDDELAQNYPPKPPTPEPLSDDDEDAIVVHGRRRVNSGVETAETVEDVENAENVDPVSSTVLIDPAEAAPTGGRQLRQRKPFPKIAGEPTSDFEPDDEESERDEDLDDSDAAPKKRRGSRSTASPRRRTGRRGGRSGGNSRKHSGSDSEEALPDPDEVADELNELKPGRRPRRRVVRHFDDDIDYGRGARRARQPVDYSIKPLTEVFAADEEAEENAPPSPARGGRKNNGPSKGWERTLHSAFGPFGGGNPITPITGAGPWGQEAAGGADSDSSDDDLIDAPRPSISGPSTGMPNLLPGLTQAIPLEPAGATAGNPANFGKVKSQKALADADPLGVDKDVDFSKVGGLAGHIDQLKEMVQMPLLYPELFLKFHVTPPRGVLFHGPPGTGKTLLARALAASVGTNGRKITFYMRKGADALSKWVGEAERQLRLLFEEARKTQPSIIFFDEIDGLAPVRSSKQEQIHASIVSTLLALMDGMDGRGQVIVIGATNRPDNIDPALRRPGRFDREFYFPLPDREGRRSIIDIHTRDWGLNDDFKDNLAKVTKGYGGADLRALTTEAALNAIQRTYPQIYSSNDKLVVDPEKIKITAKDFMLSVKKMVPSSERAASSGARPLPKVVEPLLIEQLQSIEGVLDSIVPLKKKLTALQEAMYEQYDDEDQGFGRETMQQDFERSRVFRPRLLIQGGPGMGQAYIGSALLNHFEGLHVQIFDIATIYGDNTKSPEAAVVQMFAEVKRHKPSVIYLPDVDSSWASMSESVIKTFLGLLRGIPATDPVLVLGISDQDPPDQSMIRDLFGLSRKNRFNLAAATEVC